MGNAYLWVKTFHIVFIASWFAGLFYLPRIFVNLAEEKNSFAFYPKFFFYCFVPRVFGSSTQSRVFTLCTTNTIFGRMPGLEPKLLCVP